MRDVNSRAIITIAASSGAGVHEGLYNQQSVSQLEKIEHTMVVSNTTRLNRRSELLVYEVYRKEIPPSIVECGLAERAWACQERILSPRELHFTGVQLFWECRHHCLAEEGVQSFNNFISRFSTASSIVWRLMRPDCSPFERLMSWYNDILKTYTSRQLTQASDHLPDVSGLARFVQKNSDTDMDHFAGLCNKGIQFGLYWAVWHRVSRCATNSRPSRSWTSYLTPAVWPLGTSDTFHEVQFVLEECEMELVGSGSFGQVLTATLRLTGSLLRVRARISPERRNFYEKLDGKQCDWSSEVLHPDGRFLGDGVLD
jgi:hypothetical protein